MGCYHFSISFNVYLKQPKLCCRLDLKRKTPFEREREREGEREQRSGEQRGRTVKHWTRTETAQQTVYIERFWGFQSPFPPLHVCFASISVPDFSSCGSIAPGTASSKGTKIVLFVKIDDVSAFVCTHWMPKDTRETPTTSRSRRLK